MYYGQQHIASLGKTASKKRVLKPGLEYDVLFPKPRGLKDTIARDADVYAVLELIDQVVIQTLDQTKAITEQLQKECGQKQGPVFYKALFDFVYQHIQYVPDEDGFEDLSQPAYLWANRKKGGDCDCYSIFILSCLHNAGVGEKYARIIRSLDERGNQIDHFHHIYVVVPKFPGADLSNRSNYWVIDPVLDSFDTEPKIIEKHDKQMVRVRVLSGAVSPENKSIDKEREALLAERELIRSGKSGVCSIVHRENAIEAIDYYLKYKDDPKLRASAIKNLQDRVGLIFLPSKTLGFSFSSLVDNVIFRAADVVAPGSGAAAQVAAKATNISPTDSLKKGITSIFSKGSSNANNASLRAELDQFTIPADFNVDLYFLARPDVGIWANQQGLNDAGYVRKLIARHYFTHGKSEGMMYPKLPAGFNESFYLNQYPDIAKEVRSGKVASGAAHYIIAGWKQNRKYKPDPKTQGTFDWISGQDNGASTGFHIGEGHPFKAGDKIMISVTSGDTRYSGTHTISYLGADDGTYKASMVTVRGLTIKSGVKASGSWKQVAQPGSSTNAIQTNAQPSNQTQSIQSSDGVSPWLIGGVLLGSAIGIAAVINSGNKSKEEKK